MNKESAAAGCFLVIWALFVTLPMWLVLVFAILSANDMPVWVWALYWCYVPANIFGTLLAGIIKFITD